MNPEPSRKLGLVSATALVVASMVGTGVFTTSGFLLRDLQSPVLVLLVWVAGGLMATLGAINYGALARRIPESGGEYIFLSRTLHPAAGYVAGWVSLLVGFSAPLAFAAFAFGEYGKSWWPGLTRAWGPEASAKAAGTLLLLVFSALHAAHVRRGAWVQNLTVLVKVALIALFSGFAFHRLSITPTPAPQGLPVWTFAVSLMWVSFSYSGWNAAIYISGEVRDPERNVPRAMIWGALLVTLLYLALNAIFVYAAPMSDLAGKPEVGRIAAQALGGPAWAHAVTSMVALVLVSTVSAQVMAGPRVYAKMAADGYLPRWLAATNGPPRAAIALQTILALAMLWSVTFEWLLSYIGFTLGLSTAAAVLGLIVIRRREGPRVRVIGWPWVPGLFLGLVCLITVLSIIGKPYATLAGLATMALGVGAWRLFGGSGRPSLKPQPQRSGRD